MFEKELSKIKALPAKERKQVISELAALVSVLLADEKQQPIRQLDLRPCEKCPMRN